MPSPRHLPRLGASARTWTTTSTRRRRRSARAAASWPRRRPAGSFGTSTTSGSAARSSSRGERRRSRDPGVHRGVDRAGVAYGLGGRLLSRRVHPDYGQLSGAQLEDMVAQEPNPAKEDERDFALWKAQKPLEDAAWDSPWGPGRPGGTSSARRWARSTSAPSSRSTAAGSIYASRTTRTSSPSRARAGYAVRARLAAQRDARARRREDVEVARERRHAAQRARHVGARGAAALHVAGTRGSRSTSPMRARERALALAGFREALALPARAAGDWDAFEEALEDDFNTPAVLALMHGGPRAARAGSSRAARPLRHRLDVRGARGARAAARATGECAVGEGLGERRRRAGRARGCGLGGDRPSRRHGDLASTVTSAAELVYGRRAVREALQGRREVLEVLATERAARDGWERKPKIVPERALTELAGTRDHQGVVARVEPFRYADAYELAAGEPLLVALDQVTDPRNLGAVIRSAEGAGATGVIVPAHNSARVTPAVARSSAGAVEHLPVAVVTNLARYLNEVKGPRLWIYAADAAGTPMADAGLSGGLCLVFGAEGKGMRPLVRRACDAASRFRSPARSSRSTSRSRPRCCSTRREGSAAVPEPTLYLFDGYNLLHAGGYADVRELVDQLASFVAQAGARGVVVFDGHGRPRRGPLSVRYAPHADTLLERLAAEHRGREEVSSSPRTSPSAARPASRCASSRRRRSCATWVDRATRSGCRSACRSASTRRRGPSWRGCAEGKKLSERKICKTSCNFCGGCYLPLNLRVRLDFGHARSCPRSRETPHARTCRPQSGTAEVST